MFKCKICGKLFPASVEQHFCHNCFMKGLKRGGIRMKRENKPGWIGPLFGNVVRTTDKAVLFESNYRFLSSKQWIPKIAFKVDSENCAFYVAKWFMRKLELDNQALKFGKKVEVEPPVKNESFKRRRLLRPEISSVLGKDHFLHLTEEKREVEDTILGSRTSLSREKREGNGERVFIWSRQESGDEEIFVCELSDNPTICPKCKENMEGFLAPSNCYFRECDQEGEIQSWHFKHDCGAILVVLSD